MKIAVLVGSLRKDSYNLRVVQALERLAPDDVSFAHSRLDDLPLYNQDEDGDQPAAAKRLKTEIAAADGVLFATPEYNRSIPGLLKNALDHGARPYGQSVWAGKPAGIIGVSPGAVGTATAQQHLRTILAYLDMPTLGQPEVFLQWKEGLVDDGEIGADSREFLQGWMSRFHAWVRLHAKS